MSIVLASRSPRRSELLKHLGIPFEVLPSSVDERDPVGGEDPSAYALELARHKTAAVAGSRPTEIVLGADTVVVLDGQILNKPVSQEEAVAMLSVLRGKTHEVITAVVVRGGEHERCGTVKAEVTMHDYGDDEIRRYVATGEPMDKAGAYAVQGLGGALVKRVEGCYDTVVGLPLCLVQQLLADFGLDVPETHSASSHVHH